MRIFRWGDQDVIGVEGPILSNFAVLIGVKLNNLRGPVFVVDGASSDFNSLSGPSGDLVKDLPLLLEDRLLEISIDADVDLGSVSHQLHVVDGKTSSVRFSSPHELERIISLIHEDLHDLEVDLVIFGCNCEDHFVVPEDAALT